jgi:hypothetical protein
VAEEALARGELPALAAMLEHGSRGRGVTAFPSTTTVSYLPFLTGKTPGECNVPSIRWLDRTTYHGGWWRERDQVRSYCGYQAGCIDRDIPAHARTIFETIEESIGIFTPISRGLTPRRNPSRTERQFWGAVAHYAMWHQPSDEAVSRHLMREVDGPWRFIFAQFPAVDGYTHQTDPGSPKVQRALRAVDQTVGRLRARLAQRGELEETLILLVSDHGAAVVEHHLDLADWFRRQGVPTLSHPILWERNPRAAVMVAGNGSAMVYARPDEPRAARWPLTRLRSGDAFGVGHDVIAALTAEPAVALVAAEERAHEVRVAAGAGVAEEAAIVRDGDRIHYRPVSGDPLRLGGPLSGTADEWLEWTWEAPYPDACVQLLDQFTAARTGDLVVVAREGFDFRDRYEVPEHRSGHGSLIRAHMQVPVWSSHPRPARPVRTTEIHGELLRWLEEPPRADDRDAGAGHPRIAVVA